MSSAPQPQSSSNSPPDAPDLNTYLDSASAVLGLEVRPEWREQVLFHLGVVTQAARLVEAFPLPDELDPAPIYRV